MTLNFGQNFAICPMFAPIDDTGTTGTTTYFNMARAVGPVNFLMNIGAITGDSVVVTVEASTSNSSSGAIAIPFYYRRSSAVATDVWGDVTTSDSAGITLAEDSADSNSYLITVDPSSCDGYQYLRIYTAQGSSTSDFAMAVNALYAPAYASYSPLSAT